MPAGRGIKAVAVTAGYMCAQPRAEFFGHIDAANVDLKGFTGGFYGRVCLAALHPVLETLLYLRHETGGWLEITTLLIPDVNDSDGEIDAMTRWVAGRCAVVPGGPRLRRALGPRCGGRSRRRRAARGRGRRRGGR
jgi:pyruvate-formate lyase-activating enzyme